MKSFILFFVLLLSISLLKSVPALACACGCGVFDVSTSELFPSHEGLIVFSEYDYLNQNENWHGFASALSANNDDKKITTHFFSVGGRYMFSRAWGAEINLPFAQRHFMADDGTGTINSFDHLALGDVRVKGVYSGFSSDMATGLTFGLKLPTGDHADANFDRDTQIGTGSTDILLGAYHRGTLKKLWSWFTGGQLDQPVLIQGGYRPGTEINVASGIYYSGLKIKRVKLAPVFQAVGSFRLHDSGSVANPGDSGYERLILAPGMEVAVARFKIDMDAGFPVLQHVNGNQLVGLAQLKLKVSYSF